MLNQYNVIQDGIDIYNLFNLPKEIKDYKVEVIIRPIVLNPVKKSVSAFKKSIQKHKYSLPADFKFDRDEIYGYLDE